MPVHVNGRRSAFNDPLAFVPIESNRIESNRRSRLPACIATAGPPLQRSTTAPQNAASTRRQVSRQTDGAIETLLEKARRRAYTPGCARRCTPILLKGFNALGLQIGAAALAPRACKNGRARARVRAARADGCGLACRAGREGGGVRSCDLTCGGAARHERPPRLVLLMR